VSEQLFVVVGTAAETTITVSRESSTSERPQGLVLDADEPLRVDTAPDTVEVLTGESGDLRIWHVWRDGDLIQAWEQAARLEVDDEGDDLGLVCHDGHGGSDADLVVRLHFDRAWTQPADD
jgi:hypothetical protein